MTTTLRRPGLALQVVVPAILTLTITGCGAPAQDTASTSPGVVATSPATPAPTSAMDSATVTPVAVGTPGPTPAPPTSPPQPAAPQGVAVPNPRLTPGEAFAGVTVAQICAPGYSSSVRHVDHQQYVDVYAAYGVPYPQPSGTYELDHLIPLELGGDNSDANLWPEPASPVPGFHQKDDLENRMHDLVCSGQLGLAEAQHQIASNWYAAYLKYVGA